MGHSAEYRRILDKMSFYSDQEGLYRRYLNEEANWEDHITRCHKFIMSSIIKSSPEEVIVLGSGLLVEFPLDEVLKRVERVKLIDIIHPPYVKDLAAGNNKVELIEDDLTGGMIQEVWNFSKLKPKMRDLSALENGIKEYALPLKDKTLIVSLNVLSQLDILLSDYLIKKGMADDGELIPFRRKVHESHLNMLGKSDYVLITDYRETVIGRNKQEVRKDLVLTPLPHSMDEANWTWNFDNSGNYNRWGITKFDVAALFGMREK